MCGIIGYIGNREIWKVILEGLSRLEYRGYDSAGIAVVEPSGKLAFKKAKGKLRVLAEMLQASPLNGVVGIGHTRWATHGEPSERNAHPHFDCGFRLALVHNGIIENFHQLKGALESKGHKFRSDTDTEVIVHLVEDKLKETSDIVEAFRLALRELKGAYAVGLISVDNPNMILTARLGSPLVIGIGDGENFIASDVPAILKYTRRVVFLNDGEWGVVTKNGVKVFDLDGREVQKEVVQITWDAEAAEKGGYPHFMLKEIFEQPRVIVDTLRGRLQGDDVLLEDMNVDNDYLRRINKIFIVACGTALHAAMMGKYLIEKYTDLSVEWDYGSEFRYRESKIDERTLFVAVTQSGETADTLASLRGAKEKGARVVSIVNVVGSTIARESDGVIYTHAGPEIGVASTKAYIAQLTAFYLLTLHLGKARGTISTDTRAWMNENLQRLPEIAQEVLNRADLIKEIALKYVDYPKALYLGRYFNYPNALEGALKLKEIAYTAAQGYPAGEMKHGPIALVDDQLFTVALAPQGKVYDKMISNIQEIKARGGKIIGVASDGDEDIKKFVDDVIYIPQIHEDFSPIPIAVPLQLIAYYIAAERGCDIDQPRNLAKSVTVE